jgi:hypothetical protein
MTVGRSLHATVSTSVSLIAHKLPGCSGESIRQDRGGEDRRVADADLDASGELRDRVEGRASPKGVSEVRAAWILAQHLNSLGASWQQPTAPIGREEGVDAVSRDRQQTLKVQVTTAEDEAWTELASRAEHSRRETSIAGAVAAIKRAIERKTKFAGIDEIVLAVDATDSTRYALEGVVNTFRAHHGAWAKTIGYQSIWVVGPDPSLVNRLDVQTV